jgi:hypothetical protein
MHDNDNDDDDDDDDEVEYDGKGRIQNIYPLYIYMICTSSSKPNNGVLCSVNCLQ